MTFLFPVDFHFLRDSPFPPDPLIGMCCVVSVSLVTIFFYDLAKFPHRICCSPLHKTHWQLLVWLKLLLSEDIDNILKESLLS